MPRATPWLLVALLAPACDRREEHATRAPATGGATTEPGRATTEPGGAPLASQKARAPTTTASSAPAAATSAAVAPPREDDSAAYGGCGAVIPEARLWDETTEGEVARAITAARRCAEAHDRQVLLEFVAPWCKDCREMTRLDREPGVAEVLHARYEHVRINIGRWDRHEDLRDRFGVKAIAAYVVLRAKDGELLAKTTAEPITGRRGRISAEAWISWLSHPQ